MKKRITRKAVKEMLKNDYTMLYKPMPEEIKALFPVVTISDCSEYFGFHFTEKHNGKMDGFCGFSTTCKVNDLCIDRINFALRKVDSTIDVRTAEKARIKKAKKALRDYIEKNPHETSVCICGFCFSDAQQDYMTSMQDPLSRNFQIVNNGIIHNDWIPIINNLFFRFESFGDFASINAVLNCVNIIKKNPLVNFGVWSKNTKYFSLAFRMVEKPKNMHFGKSSIFVNRVTPLTEEEKTYVDFVFTVYTKVFAEENGITINCGARACLTCLKCYTSHKGIIYINEALK